MDTSEDQAGSGPGAVRDEWLADYMARVTDFWQRTGQAGAAVANRWGDRSLEQETWTVDTVTSDMVEAWEELTPLTGEGLELCLELVRQSLQIGREDG